jgi:hypothetical protein
MGTDARQGGIEAQGKRQGDADIGCRDTDSGC